MEQVPETAVDAVVGYEKFVGIGLFLPIGVEGHAEADIGNQQNQGRHHGQND